MALAGRLSHMWRRKKNRYYRLHNLYVIGPVLVPFGDLFAVTRLHRHRWSCAGSNVNAWKWKLETVRSRGGPLRLIEISPQRRWHSPGLTFSACFVDYRLPVSLLLSIWCRGAFSRQVCVPGNRPSGEQEVPRCGGGSRYDSCWISWPWRTGSRVD